MQNQRRLANSRALAGPMLLLALLGLVGTGFAQSSSGSSGQPEGVTSGGYVIHQSIEFGYRFSDTSGSGAMYDTLVNLHEGPRIFDQSFSMRSETGEGPLFDNLYISSFGWGGDTNNVLRARADKGKWYNFQASFRRDQNFFDYDLLANPLNPPDSSPDRPANDSPHVFETRRRMTDVDLTLLPLSRFSFRLGYSHNNMSGPSFSSFHEGTDVSLFQPWNTTLNQYRFGADVKLVEGTVLSYDQTLDYYKGDTQWQLAPLNTALLPGGLGNVELGLPFDTNNRFPCSVPPGAISLIDNSGVLTNIACNGYFNYSRNQRVRTSMPTERLSLRSSYKRVDFTAAYSYSAGKMTTPLNEFFNGLVTRTGDRQFSITGPARADVISNVGDVGATVRLTEHLRVSDNFYYWAYRIPQSFLQSETAWTIPGISFANPCRPPACSLLVDVNTLTPDTTVTPTLSSFNQKLKRNQVELAWDMGKHFGARVGYRYGDKDFVDAVDLLTGDVDTIVVHEHTALLGLWARPAPQLRLNFDLEHTNNDNTIVRVAPRKQSRYRAQVNYTPRPWAVVGASLNLLEDHNSDVLTDYRAHYRNYGFNLSLSPRERFAVDLAYNFNDVLQNALICFNDTPPPGVTLPVVSGAASCEITPVNPNNPFDDPNNPLLTDSFYENNTHYGLIAVRVVPVKRVTTSVGYSIVSVSGKTPQFNILQPLGPLAYNYHQPLAKLSVDLGHNVAWNAGWNYYQYNEKSFAGPTLPRYFHTNNVSLSLSYAF